MPTALTFTCFFLHSIYVLPGFLSLPGEHEAWPLGPGLWGLPARWVEAHPYPLAHQGEAALVGTVTCGGPECET